MIFIGYKCEFHGKINEIHILINEKSNREMLGFFKISRDTSRVKIKQGSRALNPSKYHINKLNVTQLNIQSRGNT